MTPIKLLVPAAAALAAAAVQVQAQGIEVRLSGQINRALMHVDDGSQKDWFNVDNGNSSTRFRFNAQGDISPGWKAGILFEAQFQSNASDAVNFVTRQSSASLSERHMDVFFNGPWGTVRLGQGDGAANGAAEVDLSGTSVAHYSSSPDIGGAFQYRTGGVLSGTSIGDSISNQDFESRYDRLHYQSPLLSGFLIEVSWGHKDNDIWELAARYSGKLGAMGTIAAALGYSKEDASPAGSEDEVMGGSVSWLHPSGFNLTFAHTQRDFAGRDRQFDYLKVGYKFGQHAVSFDVGQGQDQAANGDESRVYGFGYVFTPAAWVELFALYKIHQLDRPGVTFDEINIAMVGTRVKF